MKTLVAYAVLPKFSEMADVIETTSNGAMIPFFASEADANEWRYRTNRASETIVELVEMKSRCSRQRRTR